MELQQIDKTRYRRHLNMASVITVAALIIFALIYAQLLIHFFADGESSNFKFNFIGVVLAVITAVTGFNIVKSHPYLHEVKYVWDLKQLHNKIYRKSHQINKAAAENNQDALIILYYYYQAAKLLYTLDDNTLTLDTLNRDITKLENQLAENDLCISTADFDASLLTKF